MKQKSDVSTARLSGNPILINLILGVIVLAWLIPTFMLFTSSIRPVGDMLTTGWWTSFLHPERFTLEN